MPSPLLHKYLGITLGLLVVTSALFYLDYQARRDPQTRQWFMGMARSFFTESSLSDGVLSGTSLKGMNVSQRQEASGEFFAPYLTLPAGKKAKHLRIEDTDIEVDEVQDTTALQVIAHLRSQKSSRYRFQYLNQGTFYLEELPVQKKTANFLTVLIGDTIYGFRYAPLEHGKVLEIIDALKQSN